MLSEEELNKKVLQYGNVLVTNREIQTLKGPRFLNDVIIEFYFLHISNVFLQSHESFRDDILLVSPAVSFFLQQGGDSHKEFAENNQVASKQVVMFTVNNNQDAGANDGGSHWSLLVYYRKSNTFVHYDSLGTNGSCAKKLFRAVKKHVATPTDESSSNAATIVDGNVDSTDANPINIGDADSNNATTIGTVDVDSNLTSTVDIVHVDATATSPVPPVNGDGDGDGDSTMIDGDSTNTTSMTDADVSISSDRVGEDNTGCGRVDNDEIQLRQHNQKKKRMHGYRYARPWIYGEEEEEMPWHMYGPPCSQRDFHNSFRYGRDSREDEYMNSNCAYGYYRRPYSNSRWDMDRDAHWNTFPRGHRKIIHEEDDSFKEEGCMPKQKNFYDCGLYVMEIARVVCEWYYLDDEAKQQQPEHQGFLCKLKGGGRFPNIGEYVHTNSLESTMRRMLLEIIQERACESGITIDLFSSDDDDDEYKTEKAIVLFDNDECKNEKAIMLFSDKNESMDDDSTSLFGPQPQPQHDKSEDEKLEDCGGVAALPQSVSSTSEDEILEDCVDVAALPESISSTSSEDEPEEDYDSMPEDKCSLFSKCSNYRR